MKKSLILTLGLCMGLTLSAADGNLMKNGGFEKISKSTKSSSKYLMQKIKEGWHVGNGPLAILPTNWVLNMGAAKVEMLKKADDAKNVHSGEYAMKVTATKTSHLYTSGAKGGTGAAYHKAGILHKTGTDSTNLRSRTRLPDPVRVPVQLPIYGS